MKTPTTGSYSAIQFISDTEDEKMALACRGKRVGLLAPGPESDKALIPADDPIHAFVAMAEPMGGLSNEAMDQFLYRPHA